MNKTLENIFADTSHHDYGGIKNRNNSTLDVTTHRPPEKNTIFIKYKDCSFIPCGQNPSPRDAHQFFAAQLSYVGKTKQDIEKIKKENSIKDSLLNTFAPKICPKSETLFNATRGKATVYTRLYSQSKLSMHSNSEIERNKSELKFSPNINKESKLLKRNAKIGDMLYNDAIRRKKRVLL
jgi:hypothetical protein